MYRMMSFDGDVTQNADDETAKRQKALAPPLQPPRRLRHHIVPATAVSAAASPYQVTAYCR